MVKKWSSERSKNKLGYLFAMVISSELLHSNHSLHPRANNHREQAPHFKGSPEGSSDQEFRSSILCDVSEISWWLISRSIENLLKMTSPNFRVGLCRIRLSPRLNSKVKWTPLWTTLNMATDWVSLTRVIWTCSVQGRNHNQLFSTHPSLSPHDHRRFNLKPKGRESFFQKQIELNRLMTW